MNHEPVFWFIPHVGFWRYKEHSSGVPRCTGWLGEVLCAGAEAQPPSGGQGSPGLGAGCHAGLPVSNSSKRFSAGDNPPPCSRGHRVRAGMKETLQGGGHLPELEDSRLPRLPSGPWELLSSGSTLGQSPGNPGSTPSPPH